MISNDIYNLQKILLEKEEIILKSDKITNKLDFIDEIEKNYNNFNPEIQKKLLFSLFKLLKDFNGCIRQRVLEVFTNSVIIPSSLLSFTLQKQIPKDFNFKLHPYFNIIDFRLSDPLPEVKIQAIKVLCVTNFWEDQNTSNLVINALTESLSDNSEKVRTEAVLALQYVTNFLNRFFKIDLSQIRILIAILEDNSQKNRLGCLSLIQKLVVDNSKDVQILIEGLSKACETYFIDKKTFFKTSYIFGQNNSDLFKSIITSQLTLFEKNNLNLFIIKNQIPLISLTGAYHKNPFPLPNYLKKISYTFNYIKYFIQNLFLEKEESLPINLDEYLNNNNININFIKMLEFEQIGLLDTANYLLNKKNNFEFLKVDEFITITKYKLQIISSLNSNFTYYPNTSFVVDLLINIKPFLKKKIYIDVKGPNLNHEIQYLELINENQFKGVVRLTLPKILPFGRIDLKFYFLLDNDKKEYFDEFISYICKPIEK